MAFGGRKMKANKLTQSKKKRLEKKVAYSLSLNLLKPKYRKRVEDNYLFVWNHCYVATEAAYHLFGKKLGYKPKYYKYENGGTHWWLEHPETGDKIDVTRRQLKNSVYKYGKWKGFQHPSPNKRTRELMLRIRRAEKIL